MAESADFLINRRSRRAFCCAVPAFLLPMAQNRVRLRVALSGSCFAETGCKGRIRLKWSPWAAGCGAWSCCQSGRINEEPEWCFVRCLQFSRNLEELAHGVRPGHADILVLEYEEIAIPRPGLCLPCSAQVQLGRCLLIGQMVALGLDDDDFLPTFMEFLPTFGLKVCRNMLKCGQRNSNLA